MIVKWKAMALRCADRLVKGKSIGKVVNQANGNNPEDWLSNVGDQVPLKVDRNKDKNG